MGAKLVIVDAMRELVAIIAEAESRARLLLEDPT